VKSFHKVIREHVLEELRGLDPVALLTVKKLIRAGLNDKNDPDAVNLRESYGEPSKSIQEPSIQRPLAQAARFASETPGRQFAKIASKEIKHKL
jgi:peroxisomal 3,2-trans-enoyl-CoA isomerase